MNWRIHHKASEDLSTRAHAARRINDLPAARALFATAAAEELAALGAISITKSPRTFAIIAVSAVSLTHKSGDLRSAGQMAHSLLTNPWLADFAAEQLRDFLKMMRSTGNDHTS